VFTISLELDFVKSRRLYFMLTLNDGLSGIILLIKKQLNKKHKTTQTPKRTTEHLCHRFSVKNERCFLNGKKIFKNLMYFFK